MQPELDEKYYDRREANAAVLHHRVDNLEKIAEETREAILSIARSIAKLATIEEKIDERHIESKEAFERAFDKIVKIEERLEAKCEEKEKQLKIVEIELAQWLAMKPFIVTAQAELPALVRMRKWIETGAMAVLGVIGLAVISLVMSDHAKAFIEALK